MKYTIAISLLAGLTAAQSSLTTTNSASGTSSSLSPTQTCLQACAAGDVNCQAKCENIPFPNASQVNQTTSCEAACPQGNGTEAETSSYASCLNSCVSSYYLTSATVAGAAATGGSNSASTTGTGSGSASTGASGSSGSGSSASGTGSSGSATGSSSSSSASASSSSGAAAHYGMELAAPVTGVLGLLMAALAL